MCIRRISVSAQVRSTLYKMRSAAIADDFFPSTLNRLKPIGALPNLN